MTKLALTLAASLLMSGAALAEQVKVGIAAEAYPPFAAPDASGNWSGWEIDIIHAICKVEAMDCVITPVAWDGIIPSLTSGQIDTIMASMSITEERMKTIDFSNKYYATPAVVVGAKGVEMAPTPEGMAGKIIGVQSSTIHEAYVQKYFAPTAAEVKIYQTQDEANQDLAAGRIDAVEADSIALGTFLETEAGKACCEMKGAVLNDPAIFGLGAGAGVRKGDDGLKAKINDGIAKIRADGSYDAITAKYFATSIYGD